MPSTLTWVDHDAEARERSLRILALFNERETRDELGLGAIRDTFSDRLFPGTSTIQTRLRYMLIVPWVYRHLEQKQSPASEFPERARKLELSLVYPLLENEDTEGVFGKAAGKSLKRLPSSVYWAGLGLWGIRRVALSQDEYHRAVDKIYAARDRREIQCKAEKSLSEEETPITPPLGLSAVTWHPRLPNPPDTFPGKIDLRLTAEEAIFLRDRICSIQSEPNSLLKHLALNCRPIDVEFPWEHAEYAGFSDLTKEILDHARLFSEVMHGAAMLYNGMLAELTGNEALLDEHRKQLRTWHKRLDRSRVEDWQLGRLWELTDTGMHTITARTRSFVEAWVRFSLTPNKSLFENTAARDLIRSRESHLKQAQSRFRSQRALDQWSGHSGLTRLSYRWRTAKTFLKDLHDGLNRIPDA